MCNVLFIQPRRRIVPIAVDMISSIIMALLHIYSQWRFGTRNGSRT